MKGLKLRKRFSASVRTGIIAFIFLFAGFQFGQLVSYLLSAPQEVQTDIVEKKDVNDKYPDSPVRAAEGKRQSVAYSRASSSTRKNRRETESFRFNPNEVSADDLQRLGFSMKQASAIVNYREKGGRFRRKSDFAASFVVSDSVYKRLEPFIDIPLVDLNVADSAQLDDLPGIGPYFVSKIIGYRSRLGGFSYPEQLMDIRNFDSLKFAAIKDLVTIGNKRLYPLWQLPEDSLELHPYVGKYAAHGIVVYKENTPPEEWSVENLDKAGILKAGMAEKLAMCLE